MIRVLSVVAFVCSVCGVVPAADEPKPGSVKPPYERLLKGDDVKRAAELNNRIEAAEKADNYPAAIDASRELQELRQRVQGRDHWEAINEAQRLSALEAIAGVSAERRAAWKTCIAEQIKASALEARAQYAAALPIRRDYCKQCEGILGEEHATTARSYNEVAFNLAGQGKAAEAEFHYKRALGVYRKVLRERHPYTATSYNNLAINLEAQGRAGQAEPYLRKALEIRLQILGDNHRNTASSYNSIAINLNARGKADEAEPLLHKALDIHQRVLGEAHRDTANIYNNLGFILGAQGREADAQPLLQKALEIRRRLLGDEHPETAISYANVAANLARQGKPAEAMPLLRKALEVNRKMLGEEHPVTANSYNNAGLNLNVLGETAEALPMLQKALEIRRRVLGEKHPGTANSYSSAAACLEARNNPAEALLLLQKSLEIRREVLGEDHPDTATSYHNMAAHLTSRCRAAEALPLHRTALGIRRRVLGENHPDTVKSSCNLAANLHAQGKSAEALNELQKSLGSFEAIRMSGAQGIDRALLETFNPRLLLSSLLAASEPVAAWEHQEFTLARGLLDQQVGQFAARLTAAELAEHERCRTEITATQKQILALASRQVRTMEEDQQLGAAVERSRRVSGELAELAVNVSRREVASGDDIRASIPADAAILLWSDLFAEANEVEEHWGCVIRAAGDPRWERLRGTGKEKAWTEVDSELPQKLREALAGPTASSAEIAALGRSLFAQRIEPLLPHLDGVRTLYVVAVDEMAGVPVELLAPQFAVGYVPSGTFLARARSRPAPAGDSLLALGDPAFGEPAAPQAAVELPPGGVLIVQVAPVGAEATGKLQAGDVLVRYGDMDVSSAETLGQAVAAVAADAAAAEKLVPVTIWREGAKELLVRDVPPGKLGVALSKEPAREAIANRRKTDAMLLSLRGGNWNELPATRVEVSQIAGLFGSERATTLVDSAASEQSLEEMRKKGDFTKYRYLHFATHGEGNNVKAFESALILSQDGLPKEPLPRAGEPFLNGQLLAREVLDYWKLDAELVTLSACETAVGKSGGGDGMLGFAQAFLTAGSRAVCLSLWKVDDTATSLLMTRFYQNLLGKRPGLEKPMGKAAALHEAKQWLRELSSEEALQLTAGATNGVVRGNRGTVKELKLAIPKPAVDAGSDAGAASKPFAHPRFWAAFILIGDPN